jgi:Domain of unknown function (DUF4124)
MAGLLVVSAICPAPAEDIYKSVDAEGHVVYSDRPNSPAAQKADVTVQRPDPKEAERLARQRMLLKAEDDQRRKQEQADSKTRAQQESDKKVQCQNARNHYNFLKDSRRIFAPGADGNREYYTDAQADAMREEARRAMNAACGT